MQVQSSGLHCHPEEIKKHRSRTILIVEDSRDEQELFSRAIEKAKIQADFAFASDGEEACKALEVCVQRGKIPDVVFLDIGLPLMNGFEVLRNIRNRAEMMGMPVVMFSSSGESTEIERSYRLGANSYVQKPVAYSAYMKTIAEIGWYWLYVNHAVGTEG